MRTKRNIDDAVVEGFGREWAHYDQSHASSEELTQIFCDYFRLFPWDILTPSSVGFDLGCGSGRWAQFVAPRVGILHCIDASEEALDVAKRNLARIPNCRFHKASVDDLPLEISSAD